MVKYNLVTNVSSFVISCLSRMIQSDQILHLNSLVALSSQREQTFDILFDGDEEEKSIATALLDSLLMV